MSTECKNCLGTGLVGGSAERPWIHQGPLSTCTICTGTVKIEEAVAEQLPEPTPESPSPEPEVSPEDSEQDQAVS